ncbi:MAG: ferritin family protein [Peptoniphilaceae bacterium]|nr:ferritin family protein [Peptoniphilaceae bacterium]MDY6019289.1 ferritin family protein [Anaerococcus sp.]
MSTEIFGPKDLLESLVRLEKNGYEFYSKASEKFDDLEVKEFFKFLANQELGHEKLYKELAEEVATSSSNTSRQSYDEEYNDYLQSLVENTFNFELDQNLKDVKNVYKFALGLEKDTIIFIGELRNILPDFKKEIFEKVEKEERGHIKLINDWYKKYINK